MASSQALTILCLASYFKGENFLIECRRLGCRVLLVTLKSLADAAWPREAVDEFFYMEDFTSRDDLVKGVSWLARSHRIERIVPLDDYDVETAAYLREHFRLPGMGDTTARYFRDKLAMRSRAQSRGIDVPDFVHALNDESLREYMSRVPAPWVLKPRSEASAIGIRKFNDPQQVWQALEELGDRRSFHLLERFVPGDIFHVDGIVWEGEAVFAVAHQYGTPPMQVAHEGGVFTSRRIPDDGGEGRALLEANRRLMTALGFVRGVTHTEFIRGREDGRFYFLETAARVGGANIAELVHAATGIDLWAEWARIEIAGEKGSYSLPSRRDDYAGILISLARQESPDLSGYVDPEVVWRLKKKNHAGVIVASPDPDRVRSLLDEYSLRFQRDFYASLPLPAKPTS